MPNLKERVERICDSFSGQRIDIPSRRSEIRPRLQKVHKLMSEVYEMIQMSSTNFDNYLTSLADEGKNEDGISKIGVFHCWLDKAYLTF